ncbi:MAG TPA: NAD(P)-binding protein, partial [Myxococcota bacterium]
MTYSGPKNIVIVGAGISGLAAADAITKSLADYAATGRALPPDLTVTVVEGEDQVGGRATTWDVNAIDPKEHPLRHHAGHTPHGIHFFWHSYRHFDAWTSDFPQAFSPAIPTSSYNMWVTPPDYPAGFDHEGALVPVHICNPRDPSSAWNPHARALLDAFLKRDSLIVKLETFVRTFLADDIAVDDWLAFLDLLFDEEHLSPFLRWGVFFGPIFAAQLGRVETNPTLKDLLGGRAPQDVEVGELMRPFFQTVIVERLRAAHAELAPLLEPDAQPTSVAPVDAALTAVRDTALRVAGGLLHGLQSIVGAATGGPSAHPLEHAIEAFLALILRDARVILDGAATFDPKSSGYLKNLYKAAFSSPFSFDLATAMRDIQMGHRNYECAKLQVFDGDDAQALWEHIKDRILARAPTVNVRFVLDTWVTRFDVDT